VDNIELVKGWLRLALEDWASIIELDYKKHRGIVVYHSQQFVEKLCKAIIASLGFEPPKTHTPSVEIDSIIAEYRLGNMKAPLNETLINILEQISLQKYPLRKPTVSNRGMNQRNKVKGWLGGVLGRQKIYKGF